MKRVVLLAMALAGIHFFFLSCQTNALPGKKENVEFYYYPSKNVYYNVEKNIFLYSLDGGKTWDSVVNSLPKEPVTLGEKIIIYSADRPIYKDNAGHRKLYNGKLYNIIDAETVLPSPETTQRKIQKKAISVKPQQEEQKQPKGLKKFLKKIFGKHSKKPEDQ